MTKTDFTQTVLLCFFLTPAFKVFLLRCYLFMQISHTQQKGSEGRETGKQERSLSLPVSPSTSCRTLSTCDVLKSHRHTKCKQTGSAQETRS